MLQETSSQMLLQVNREKTFPLLLTFYLKKKKGVNQWFLVSVNNTDFFQFYIDLFVGHCKHIMMGLLIFN